MSSGSLKTYLVLVIILTSLMIRYVAVFGDEGSRHKMIHPVQIPLARHLGEAELREAAIEEGMLTLRMDGIRQVEAGVTTVEEGLRETAEDK